MTHTIRYLTPRLIAESAGVRVETVLAWIHSKRLNASNISMSNNRPRWRISERDFEKFMTERSNQANVATKAKRQPKKTTRQYV